MDYQKTLSLIHAMPHRDLYRVAARSGVPFSTVRSIKYAQVKTPYFQTLEKIAAVLGQK